jgi:TrmH family RNA methyltransferase
MLASPFSPLSQSRHQAVRRLHKKSEREAEQLFFVEGEKLCREALTAHAPLEYAVVSSDAPESAQQLADELHESGVPVYASPAPKFHQLCDAATPQGILAVVRYLSHSLASHTSSTNTDIADSFVLALDAVADPGNVGTIIRTADWFGVRFIILGEGCADRYNPKVVRATMGSVFRCAVMASSNLAHALQHDFPTHRFYGASVQASMNLVDMATIATQHPASPLGIVLGSEAHGISPEVASVLAGTFAIEGVADGAESLNVAVAAGIVLHHLFAPTP